MTERHLLRTTALVLLLAVSAAAAGPPLVFEKSEYAARRAKLMAAIPDGAAVFLAAQPLTGYFPFVQANDFLYLCGVEAPGAALIVDGMRKESLLFLTLTERAARNEGLSLDLVKDPAGATGVERALPIEQLTSWLGRLASQGNVLYTPFQPEELARECSLEKGRTLSSSMVMNEWDGRPTRERRFVSLLEERFPGVVVKDCSAAVWEMRTIKSPAEIDLLRRAGRIGVEACLEMLKSVRPGMREYELAARYEYECKRRGAQDLAYYAIVCSAENHPYLHYYKADRLLQDGDFVVMDCGPDVHNYDIDITVSFPVNGRFTPRQKEIYEAALAVHEANLSLYRPGLTREEVREKVREILVKRGFDLTKDVFRSLSGGFGHYVGMAVHDVGGSPAVLAPGMVFANEPLAVYPDENLGVRVENSVLITATGCENLTAGIPRTVAEIEAHMKRK